jgi:heme exporter protein A
VPAATPRRPVPVHSPEPLPLVAERLERRFGAARVLTGVDLAVRGGDLQVVAGPNGAGKTTLLRILAGLTRPTTGMVHVFGHALRQRPDLRRHLGLLSHQSLLYDDLTPEENLAFAARLYGLPAPRQAVEEALEAVGLTHRSREPVRRLSRGMIQRVAIARALLHRPRVLLLDEPFTGLDAPSVQRMLEVLGVQQAAGTALVLVSHTLTEVWPLATRISVLVRGRWVIDEPRPADREAFLARFHEALGD